MGEKNFKQALLESFGNGIRENREEIGLTQKELAARIPKVNGQGCMSPMYISRIEQGKVDFRAITLDNSCCVFGCTVYDFIINRIDKDKLLNDCEDLNKLWLALDESSPHYFNQNNFSLKTERKNKLLSQYELADQAVRISGQLNMPINSFDQVLISRYENTTNKSHRKLGVINFFILFLALNLPEL